MRGTAEARRSEILRILRNSKEPVSGEHLGTVMKVSRQIIVQDIALLRSGGHKIESTNRGYLLYEEFPHCRIFKAIHSDEAVEDELNLIVDMGGEVLDVFISHKVYGIMKGALGLRSRLDVRHYLSEIGTGASSLLKNVTSGYHYHTVAAESEERLDLIEAELDRKGFLVPMTETEQKELNYFQNIIK